MKSVALEEAYRLIRVREGDGLVEIPVMQAAFRGIAINAAKGQRTRLCPIPDKRRKNRKVRKYKPDSAASRRRIRFVSIG